MSTSPLLTYLFSPVYIYPLFSSVSCQFLLTLRVVFCSSVYLIFSFVWLNHAITEEPTLVMSSMDDSAHLLSWNDGTLKVCFWSGLNNHLICLMPRGETSCILAQYVDYTLWLTLHGWRSKRQCHSVIALAVHSCPTHPSFGRPEPKPTKDLPQMEKVTS